MYLGEWGGVACPDDVPFVYLGVSAGGLAGASGCGEVGYLDNVISRAGEGGELGGGAGEIAEDDQNDYRCVGEGIG